MQHTNHKPGLVVCRQTIRELWPTTKTNVIAARLGVHRTYVARLAKQMKLRPRKFYKSYVCPNCKKKHNPHIKSMERKGMTSPDRKWCRACVDARDEKAVRTYQLRAEGYVWKDIALKVGGSPSAAYQRAEVYAFVHNEPWPIVFPRGTLNAEKATTMNDQGMSYKAIAVEMHTTASTVSRTIRKWRYQRKNMKGVQQCNLSMRSIS